MTDASFACSTSSTCLAIRVSRRLTSSDVIDVISDLFILRGLLDHIRSDNGPEFPARAMQEWIGAVGATTAYITPGSPWENGFIESLMYGHRVIAASR
jgi:putative transposase